MAFNNFKLLFALLSSRKLFISFSYFLFMALRKKFLEITDYLNKETDELVIEDMWKNYSNSDNFKSDFNDVWKYAIASGKKKIIIFESGELKNLDDELYNVIKENDVCFIHGSESGLLQKTFDIYQDVDLVGAYANKAEIPLIEFYVTNHQDDELAEIADEYGRHAFVLVHGDKGSTFYHPLSNPKDF